MEKVRYKIPANKVKFFFVAVGDRTIIANPDHITKIFHTYEEAREYQKIWIPEDGPAIYVIYEDKFLLVYGKDKNTGDFIISYEFFMDKYIIGVKKMQELVRENYYGKNT